MSASLLLILFGCHISIGTANNIDEKIFHNLRRDDLNDLFPEEFILRKRVADFFGDLVSDNNA